MKAINVNALCMKIDMRKSPRDQISLNKSGLNHLSILVQF